jgi:uncharacterized membrane protein YgcG
MAAITPAMQEVIDLSVQQITAISDKNILAAQLQAFSNFEVNERMFTASVFRQLILSARAQAMGFIVMPGAMPAANAGVPEVPLIVAAAPAPFLAGSVARRTRVTEYLHQLSESMSSYGLSEAGGAPPLSSDLGTWLFHNTSSGVTENLVVDQLYILPATPNLRPITDPPGVLNTLALTDTWVILRYVEGAASLNPAFRLIGTYGRVCSEFFAEAPVSIDERVVVSSSALTVWRSPIGDLRADISITVATHAAHRILNAPVSELSAAEQIQRQTELQLQAQQGHFTQMQLLQREQLSFGSPSPGAAPTAYPGDSAHTTSILLSEKHQVVIAETLAIKAFYDSHGTYLTVHFPRPNESPSGDVDEVSGDSQPLMRTRIATFSVSVEHLHDALRGDTASSFLALDTFPPVNDKDMNFIVRFQFDKVSIKVLMPSHGDFEKKLSMAFDRLIVFAVSTFGSPMATHLHVLRSSILALTRAEFSDKLPESFLIILIDGIFEKLRRLSTTGPASAGLSFHAWANRIVSVDMMHPQVLAKINAYKHQSTSPKRAVPDNTTPDRSPKRPDNGNRGGQGGLGGKGGNGGNGGNGRGNDRRGGNGGGNAGGKGGGGGRDTSAKGAMLPPILQGAPPVCFNWIRQSGACSNKEICAGTGNPKVFRAHSFENWPLIEAANYQTAVLKSGNSPKP